jgi:hypothetical protein
MSTASLVWGMLFGAIGGGYLIYGHRQKQIVALSCGLALMVYTWFITNSWLIVLIGAVLMVLPFKFRV